jgi:hypothetical protein
VTPALSALSASLAHLDPDDRLLIGHDGNVLSSVRTSPPSLSPHGMHCLPACAVSAQVARSPSGVSQDVSAYREAASEQPQGEFTRRCTLTTSTLASSFDFGLTPSQTVHGGVLLSVSPTHSAPTHPLPLPPIYSYSTFHPHA